MKDVKNLVSVLIPSMEKSKNGRQRHQGNILCLLSMPAAYSTKINPLSQCQAGDPQAGRYVCRANAPSWEHIPPQMFFKSSRIATSVLYCVVGVMPSFLLSSLLLLNAVTWLFPWCYLLTLAYFHPARSDLALDFKIFLLCFCAFSMLLTGNQLSDRSIIQPHIGIRG